MPEFRLLLYSYESFAKIAQASAMRVYSQIAERRFIFCKDKQLNRYCQTFLHLKTFSSFFPPFYTLPFYTLPFYTSKTSCRFALLLPIGQWGYDKSRVRLPYTNFSPLFICTSFTNFLTSADESSFLHINSTLPSSATI